MQETERLLDSTPAFARGGDIADADDPETPDYLRAIAAALGRGKKLWDSGLEQSLKKQGEGKKNHGDN